MIDRNDGMSVTIGTSPADIASINTSPLPSEWLPLTHTSAAL